MHNPNENMTKTRRFRAILFLAVGQLLAVGAMAAVISIADDDAAPAKLEEARIAVSGG